jgi:phosphatidylglycerol:prolipoprotein diacylglycerol transferase
MYPFLVDSAVRVPTYGILVMLAFVAAFALAHRRARQLGIPLRRMIPVDAAAAIFGLGGAHLLFAVAVYPGFWALLADPLAIFRQGGLAFYGGLLGGALGVVLVAWKTGLPGWKLVDALAPPTMLGLGIGRFACLFAGCCFGAAIPAFPAAHALLPRGGLGQVWLAAGFPFVGLEFHRGSAAGLLDVPLYPTQLWSAAAGLALAAALAAAWKYRRFDGQILAAMLVVEPITRIVIESYRADDRGYAITWEVASIPAWLPPGFRAAGDWIADPTHPGPQLVGVTTSQFIGLAMIIVGIAIAAARWRTPVGSEPVELS